jgi:glycerol-3-phosphate O-acyltransferase
MISRKTPNQIDIETLTSEHMVQVGAQALRKYLSKQRNQMSGPMLNDSEHMEPYLFEARVVLEAVANNWLHKSLNTDSEVKIIDDFDKYQEDVSSTTSKISKF